MRGPSYGAFVQPSFSLLLGKMNQFLRTLLFVSSLAPAILVGALAQLCTRGSTVEIYGWLIASGLACLLPLLAMVEAGRRTAVIPFKAKKVELFVCALN